MQKNTPNKNQNSASQAWKDMFNKQSTIISANVKELQKFIKRQWQKKKKEVVPIPRNAKQTVLEYFKAISKFTQKIRFQSQKKYADLTSDKKILFNLYKNYREKGAEYFGIPQVQQNQKWTLSLTQKVFSQIQQLSESLDEQTMVNLLTYLSLLTNGYLPINSSKKSPQNELIEYKQSYNGQCRYYFFRFNQINILLSIGRQMIPKFKQKSIEIEEFKNLPTIELLKSWTGKIKKQKIDQFIQTYQYLRKISPIKNFKSSQFQKNQIKMKQLKKRTKLQYFNYEKLKENEINNLKKRLPLIYEPKKLQKDDIEQFLFRFETYKKEYSKKFTPTKKSKKNQEKMQQKIQEQIEDEFQEIQLKYTISQEMAQKNLIKKDAQQRCYNFDHSGKLIEMMQQIQKPPVKNLSETQKNIIYSQGNSYTIGRSGTGKSLCALIKLFLIQHNLKLHKSPNKRLKVQDFNIQTGLKSIFLTVSSQLIRQIKKSYDQLLTNVKSTLLSQNPQQLNLGIFDQLQNKIKQSEFDSIGRQLDQDEIKIKKFTSLKGQQFPGFYPINCFVEMLDLSLQEDSLIYGYDLQLQQKLSLQKKISQSKNNNLKTQKDKIRQGQQSSSQDDLQYQEFEDPYLNEQKQEKKKKKISKKKLKQQVTFYKFQEKFFKKIIHNLKIKQFQLTPLMIWSQIISTIKGSYQSHKTHTKYLSRKQYLNIPCQQRSIIKHKNTIYSIFQQYERQKNLSNRYYDIMDLVNHLLTQIEDENLRNKFSINYLFIDEVQDLPPATLYLLTKLVENGVFYSGDSAQTISKGVKFRFSDIPTIFSDKWKKQNSYNLKNIQLQPQPDKKVLSDNYRSHNQILKLGHSIISMIELLFKGAIDTLDKENSYFRGPVPMIIHGNDDARILHLLVQPQQIPLEKKKQYQEAKIQDGKYFKIRAKQMIIVRNDNQKPFLPFRMSAKQTVVLSLQEVKGLQYDDVILIDFFSSYFENKGKQKQWELLKYLKIRSRSISKQEYEKDFEIKEHLKGHQLSNNTGKQQIYDDDLVPKLQQIDGKHYYRVPQLYLDEQAKQKMLSEGINMSEYYELLTQFKSLYTAVTRAKRTFILYQRRIQNIPKFLRQKLVELKVIRFIDDKNYHEIKQRLNRYRANHQYKNKQSDDQQFFKEGLIWYRRGQNSNKKQDFQKAILNFDKCNDKKYVKFVQSLMKFKQAKQQKKQIQHQLKNPNNQSKALFKIKKKSLQARKKPIIDKFYQAAEVFEEIKQYKRAGQCYYQAQNYERSLKCFQKINDLQQQAKCYKKLNDYQKAGYFYQQSGNYDQMIKCYESCNNYQLILQKLELYKDEIRKSQQKLVKYTELYLTNRANQYLNTKKQRQVHSQQILVQKAVYKPVQDKIYEKKYHKNVIQDCMSNLQSLVTAQKIISNKKHPKYKQYKKKFGDLDTIQYNVGLIRQKYISKVQYIDLDQYESQTNKLIFTIDPQRYQHQNHQRIQQINREKNILHEGNIFNFFITRQALLQQIKQSEKHIKNINTKQIQTLKKLKIQDHHLYLQNKFVQCIFLKNNSQLESSYSFIKKLQSIGQFDLALLICEYYGLYDVAKKLIISKIVKINHSYKKQRRVKFITDKESYKNSCNILIKQLLNKLNSRFLMTQIQRTLSIRQNVIDTVIESLLIQGYYKNALEYMDKKKQKYQLTYAFMDFQAFKECLVQNRVQYRGKINQQQYIFFDQDSYPYEGGMINSLCMQQIFYKFDSIQENPFLSQINWQTGIVLDDIENQQISLRIEQYISRYENQIKITRQQLAYHQNYYYALLQQFQHQFYIKNQSIQKYQSQINSLKDQIAEISRQLNQIHVKKQELKNDWYHYSHQLKQIDFSHQNKLKQQKIKLRLYFDGLQISFSSYLNELYTLDFYNFQHLQSDNNNKRQQQGLNSNSNENKRQIQEYKKQGELSEEQNSPKNTRQFQNFKISIQAEIKGQIQNKIIYKYQSELINEKTPIQQKLSFNLQWDQQLNLKQKRLQQQSDTKENNVEQINVLLNYFNNLQKQHYQKQQTQKNQINLLRKTIEYLQNDKNKRWDQARLDLYNYYESQKIQKNKQAHRKDVIQDLSKNINLSKNTNNGFFSVFLQLTSQILPKQNMKQEQIKQIEQNNKNRWKIYKRKLLKTLQNSQKQFSKLNNFQICQIIALYLSVILYHESSKLLQNLKIQQIQQKGIIKSSLQNNKKSKQQQTSKLKQKFYSAINQDQKRQIITRIDILRKQIIQIQQKIPKVDKNQNITLNRLKNMLRKVYKYTNSIQNQFSLNFIEQFLGFFQCRLINNCKSLWFLQKQYALVSSSSIIAKNLLSNLAQDKFLFMVYYDQNKNFILIKFKNAYLTMKHLIRQKHKQFLKSQGLKEQLWHFYQDKDTKYKIHIDQSRKDIKGIVHSIYCAFQQRQQNKIHTNYQIYSKNRYQKQLKQHKSRIFNLYYGNGFKSIETFHFIHYQLKIIHQCLQLLKKSTEFCNNLMIYVREKLEYMNESFNQWWMYLKETRGLLRDRLEDEDNVEGL